MQLELAQCEKSKRLLEEADVCTGVKSIAGRGEVQSREKRSVLYGNVAVAVVAGALVGGRGQGLPGGALVVRDDRAHALALLRVLVRVVHLRRDQHAAHRLDAREVVQAQEVRVEVARQTQREQVAQRAGRVQVPEARVCDTRTRIR